MTEGVYTLRENTKWTRYPEDGKWLAGKSNSQTITQFLVPPQKKHSDGYTHSAKITPHNPVENTTSIAP